MLNFSRKQRSSVTRVSLAVHLLRSLEVSGRHQQSLEQHLLQHQYNKEESVEEQWRTLKECNMTSADAAVGCARKK